VKKLKVSELIKELNIVLEKYGDVNRYEVSDAVTQETKGEEGSSGSSLSNPKPRIEEILSA